MAGCQAVKPNGKHCCNYARRGMTCCYSHRYLENTESELEPNVINVCCCKTSKGTNCPVNIHDKSLKLFGDWYCWRHEPKGWR